MTDTPVLPAPVDRFVEAVNAGDTEAFLGFFPDDGVMDDWGRRFVGQDAIRGWSDKEFIGAQGRMTGPSRFVFVRAGERIQEMQITSA